MRKVIVGLFIILWAVSIPVFAMEVAPRISDKEIIERLTRLEEGQKSILREMDKRFETMDKRFETMDKRFESIDKRFDQFNNLIIGIITAFSAMVAVTIGFAIWDRRTMIRPFEEKVKRLEETDRRLIEVLRNLANEDKRLAEVLRNFGLF